MSDNDKLAVYLKLQQVILDCEDNEALIYLLLKTALQELPSVGLHYVFLHTVIFDTNKQIANSFYADQQSNNTTIANSGSSYPIFVKHDAIVQEDSTITSQLNDNKLFITDDIQRYIEGSYRKIATIKTLIFSPLYKSGKVIGLLLLAVPREKNKIHTDELELIEIFTNLLAMVYRLYDTQSSLTSITQEVYKMNAKLHQLDKLKDDFVSVASHELRTPMTAIKSYLWMALHKNKQELSPAMQKYIDRAYLSVERLISLVNDMLNISRIEGGRIALDLDTVNLVTLGDEVKEEVLAKAKEKGVEVTVMQTNVPNVLCDKDKIHQVYLNLVGNSLKFTPGGGKITVAFAEKGEFVEVSVQDTGHGIAAEDLQRLFRKFGRLDNSYVAMAESTGTGLGLYISRSLVELHKGTIEGFSEGIGKGAMFTFSLPIVGTAPAQELEKDAPKETEHTKDLEKPAISV